MNDESSLRVLVCDDDDNRIKYFNRGLIGARVDRASTPNEAARFLLNNMQPAGDGYDAVFLDYDYDEEHTGKNGHGTDISTFILSRKIQFGCAERKTVFIIHSCNKQGRVLMMNDIIESDLPFIMMEPLEWKREHFCKEYIEYLCDAARDRNASEFPPFDYTPAERKDVTDESRFRRWFRGLRRFWKKNND